MSLKCDVIGPLSLDAFERTLMDADLLVTSPGSTTILQAMSINLPTLLLPAQNRSQFFNARVYSKPGADIMQWSGSVLDEAKLERIRSQGLSAVNCYIYMQQIRYHPPCHSQRAFQWCTESLPICAWYWRRGLGCSACGTGRAPATLKNSRMPERSLGEMKSLEFLLDTQRKNTKIIRYEDLVTNPVEIQSDVASFFGLRVSISINELYNPTLRTARALSRNVNT